MNKYLYWFLSLTWGLPMTLIGFLVSAVLLLMGYKPKRFGYTFYFEVGKNWGGLELGAIFLISKGEPLETKQHEHGHGIQNLWWGPLMPFVVSIPSACRYWYREYLVRSGKKKYYELPDYDSIWFEGQATRLGKKYFKEG